MQSAGTQNIKIAMAIWRADRGRADRCVLNSPCKERKNSRKEIKSACGTLCLPSLPPPSRHGEAVLILPGYGFKTLTLVLASQPQPEEDVEVRLEDQQALELVLVRPSSHRHI